MRERDHLRQDGDPYWSADVALGEAVVERSRKLVRLKLHRADETYREHREIVPLTHPVGRRTYVHAKPYVLVPDITVTVGLYSTPRPDGAVGEVTGSEWRGLRHLEIGQAQARLYHADRTLVLWEALLHPPFRRDADPAQDAALVTFWTGFEQVLLEQLAGRIDRIVTPAWEPDYPEPEVWPRFLTERGYQPFTDAAFAKPVLPRHQIR